MLPGINGGGKRRELHHRLWQAPVRIKKPRAPKAPEAAPEAAPAPEAAAPAAPPAALELAAPPPTPGIPAEPAAPPEPIPEPVAKPKAKRKPRAPGIGKAPPKLGIEPPPSPPPLVRHEPAFPQMSADDFGMLMGNYLQSQRVSRRATKHELYRSWVGL